MSIDEGPESGARPGPDVRSVEAVIGDCGLYEAGRRRPGRVPLGQAAQAASGRDSFVWMGLQQATPEEITAVAREFALPALAVEDAITAHQRPKLEVYEDVVFVVLKPVRYVDHDEVVQVTEIALFVGETFVVTVRHGASDVLRTVRSELDSGRLDVHGHFASSPTAVLHRAADLVVDGYLEAAERIEDDIEEIELQVFGEEEGEHSERIYKLKREIAEFRRAVHPLAQPITRVVGGQVPGLDRRVEPYFRDVHDHLLRAIEVIDAQDRLLSDVLQADLARAAARQSRIAAQQNAIALRQAEIAVRQNEDMRKISAWAAIGLVPTAIAGIYGMNFENMPELGWRYGYFAVLAVITTVCVALHRAFRRNGWL